MARRTKRSMSSRGTVDDCGAATSAASAPPVSVPGDIMGSQVTTTTYSVNRRCLGRLVRDYVYSRCFRDASGALAAFLKGTPGAMSYHDSRSAFVAAMEIANLINDDSDLSYNAKRRYYKIIRLYTMWMKKLTWLEKSPKKKLIKLEFALFDLMLGDIKKAYIATKELITDRGCMHEPALILMQGMIAYHLWYEGLPTGMKLEEFNVHMLTNDPQETYTDSEDRALLEASDDDSTANSEPDMIFRISDCSVRIEKFCQMNGYESHEEGHNSNSLLCDFSKLRGLDVTLLPIKMQILESIPNEVFESYTKYLEMHSDYYENAENYLKAALHMNPPVMAALLPLTQLLLLGNKVRDAFDELEKCCLRSNVALPFRLRAQLLECVSKNDVVAISECYRNALRMDPSCNYSVEKVLKLYRLGCYDTIEVLEILASHLDCVDGKTHVWEELAACFVRLLTNEQPEFQDSASYATEADPPTYSVSPFACVFDDPHRRESWKVRCRWWSHRHFSKNACTSETQAGDYKLLAHKAACASHLYGPDYGYVKATHKTLLKAGPSDKLEMLQEQMRKSVKLMENLG